MHAVRPSQHALFFILTTFSTLQVALRAGRRRFDRLLTTADELHGIIIQETHLKTNLQLDRGTYSLAPPPCSYSN